MQQRVGPLPARWHRRHLTGREKLAPDFTRAEGSSEEGRE